MVVEPTPKASEDFFVPSTRFMPEIKLLGGKKSSGLSTAPASLALASPAIDAQGAPVSSSPAKNKLSEIGFRFPLPLSAVGTKVRMNLRRNVNQSQISR